MTQSWHRQKKGLRRITIDELGEVENLVEWAKASQTEFYKMLARLMPREIKADVNTGVSLIECLREIDEREANAKESWLLMVMVIE